MGNALDERFAVLWRPWRDRHRNSRAMDFASGIRRRITTRIVKRVCVVVIHNA